MLKVIRTALETYATGMGVPAATVIREFKALPEGDKFRMLAAIKELEKRHQEWLANDGKPPAPPVELAVPPPPDLAEVARSMRGEYALRRMLARQSPILDVSGRPIRRD
jgi:hypothetical protein